jgi:plasmid segregation protein ParM
MIISIDHGNKSIKLPGEGRIFTSGLCESDTQPPFGEDILKYKGKYYTLSDKRITYMRDKTEDERFYILTLFAIAFEIEDTGCYNNNVIPIQLLVGLPPLHYGAQYERFEKYFMRGDVDVFEFHGKKFKIKIEETVSYPQAFAAAITVYNRIKEFPKVMVIDIGGFTADYLMIKKGKSDLTICDTLENGVILLYNQIISKINSELDMLLDESDIDAILKEESIGVGDNVKHIVTETAQVFISDLFGKLRERSIDLRSGKTVFIGGGSILLKKQIEASSKVSSLIFVDQISANAKGYEILYKASKRR